MAQNTKNKKTSLGEDAYIYNKRNEDDLTEKEKLASMTKEQKKAYFFDYYSKPLIIGALIILAVGFIIYHDFIARKDVFYHSAIMNETIQADNLSRLNADFLAYEGYTEDDKKEVGFNTYYSNYVATMVNSTAAADLQTIASQIYAGTLDSMICDKKTMANYLDNGFFMSMKDFLTKEEYEKLKPYFYIPKVEKNKDHKAYGIYLTDSKVYSSYTQDELVMVKKPILGVIFNSKKKDDTRNLLYFLFPELLGQKPASKSETK